MMRPSSKLSLKYSLVLTLLVTALAALLLGQPARWATLRGSSVRSQAALPKLQGPAATEYLKQQGLSGSLGAAMRAARYGVYAAPAAEHAVYQYYANNPAQQMQARFAPTGLSLYVASATKQSWQLGLKLRSAGYGERQYQLSPGTLTAKDNRVEIARAIESLAAGFPITEWYVNRAEGLEHGFTLAQPLGERCAGERCAGERCAGERLRLVLQVDGDWQMQVVEDGRAVELRRNQGGETLRYDKLVVQDATGQELQARMQTQGSELWLEVEEAGAAYPVAIDPIFTQVKKLVASDGEAGDNFGFSVALNGDTAIIGAYLDDVGDNSNQGAAYIFARNAGGTDNWGQVKKLTNTDGVAGDYFGSAVLLSGDFALIGVRGDILHTTAHGSAYIFERNAGGADNWGQVKKLIASDGAFGDLFGRSVAFVGDTAIIGASGDDVGSNVNQGSAYVFERNAGGIDNWGEVKKLTISDGAEGDLFGHSVAFSGDTAIISVVGDKVGSNAGQGSAYIFERNSGGTNNWGQVKMLIASDGMEYDEFGVTVALSSDTAVIGAYSDNVGSNSRQGSAYIFVRDQGGVNNWGQVKKLTASDGAAYDFFGNSVTLSGDVIIVGAQYYDDLGATFGRGSAYIFERNTGGANNWGQVQKLTASDGTVPDDFGTSVAISGETIIVGAPHDDVGSNSDQGSAYVFANQCGNWVQVRQAVASDGAANDVFGDSVAISGDTAIVGATLDNVGSNGDQGSAYIFKRNTGGADNWGQVKKLVASDGTADDRFGLSVAISGDAIIVGAWFDNAGNGNAQGSAYIFERNTGGVDNWGQVKKLVASDGVANDNFGVSVAISNDTAIAGASGSNNNQGSAYIFARNMGGADNWGQVQKLVASDGAAIDSLGWSVAVSGDTAIVGALHNKEGSNFSQGSAYIFKRDLGGTNNWGQLKKLLASDGAMDDRFGESVAISGDTAVVGANGKVGDIRTGSAYIFTRNMGGADNWGQVKKLTASDGEANDGFGYSVAISGNIVIVGTPSDDTGSNNTQGAAYIFERSTGGTDNWGQVQKLVASDGAAGDNFGYSVAISGNTAIVGAREKMIGINVIQGAAYVFGLTCPSNATPTISAVSITRQAGSPWANSQIATASDTEDPQNILQMQISSDGTNFSNTATLNGVTITLTDSNTSATGSNPNATGQVFADVVADCSANSASFTLKVTDSGGATASALLTVTVNANTQPTLGYANWAVKPTGTLTFSPLQVSDNGSIIGLNNSSGYSVSDYGGLPVASLSVSPIGKVTISDAPNTPGMTYTPTIRARDNCGLTTDASFTLCVFDCETLAITNALTGLTVGTLVNEQLNVTPANTYAFTLSSGALPPGLTLSTSGWLSGTPTAGGAFNFTIRISSNCCVKHQTFSLNVGGSGSCQERLISLPNLAIAQIGAAYNHALTASPASTYNYAWTLNEPGFAFDCATNCTSQFLRNANVTGAPRNVDFVLTASESDSPNCAGSRAYRLKIRAPLTALALLADYDGDAVSDYVVWSGERGEWHIRQSRDGQTQTVRWGTQGDVPLLGDYDGDGKTDLAVWRPSNGTWYIKRSSDGQFILKHWGASTDVPVPGDFDGDQRTDFAVWRPSAGNWYVWRSRDQQYEITPWGAGYAPYDDVPLPGDYDGDGQSDLAVFRRGNGTWYVKQSRTVAVLVRQWGLGTDVPVPNDYDSDGKCDLAVWRGASGNWYALGSRDNQISVRAWGLAAAPYHDVPAPGDYDGDGKADLAVWRAANSTWYVLRSDNGAHLMQQHGQLGDKPVSSAQRP